LTTAATRRFRERAARALNRPAPDPIAAPEPPVPTDWRGWKGQTAFSDLTPDEIASRYLLCGPARPTAAENETRRLVRAWLDARPQNAATVAAPRKRKTK
jgi:hypothetical protein